MANDPLAEAYQKFVDDSDATAFLAAIEQFGGCAPSGDVDYPESHRVCDHRLNGAWYRVVRIFDLEDGRSRLYVYPTDVFGTHQGVPFWLQGSALRQWIMDEIHSPTDGEPDWEEYRSFLG